MLRLVAMSTGPDVSLKYRAVLRSRTGRAELSGGVPVSSLGVVMIPHILICTIFIASVSCADSTKASAAAGLVPADAIAWIDLDWKNVRANQALAEAVGFVQMEHSLVKLGFESDDIVHLTAFVSGGNESDQALIIRGGSATRAVFMRDAKRCPANSYRGYEISQCDAKRALTRTRSGALVLGTKSRLESVIDAERDRSLSVLADSVVRNLMFPVNAGRYPITIVLLVPGNFRDMTESVAGLIGETVDILGYGPLGSLLVRLGRMRGVTLAFDNVSDGTIPVRLRVHTGDERTAALASGSLGLLQGLASFLPGSAAAPEVQAAMKMVVERKGALLSIALTIPSGSIGVDRTTQRRTHKP